MKSLIEEVKHLKKRLAQLSCKINNLSFDEVVVDYNDFEIQVTDSLPNSFPECTNKVNIDITLTSDLDITNWSPSGLCKGAVVSIRKIDENCTKLIFNDGVILYDFVDKKGDYLTLFWNGVKFKI